MEYVQCVRPYILYRIVTIINADATSNSETCTAVPLSYKPEKRSTHSLTAV